MKPKKRVSGGYHFSAATPALADDMKKEQIRRMRTELDRKVEEIAVLQRDVNKLLKELFKMTGQHDVGSHGQ